MNSAGLIMPPRSIGEIISKTSWCTWRELLFLGHLERKLKEQQTQVNLLLNKKSTPWLKLLEFTYWLPIFKKLISPFLNAFMQASLQQSTWWNSPTLHMPSENKVQGRTVSGENIFLWWWMYQKWKLILPDTEMSTLSQWRKGPWKGHYVTINIIPYSPEIDYFQPHYLDVTSNNPLSRKDLRKDGILKFSNLWKEDVGNWGQGYQLSQQKYSVQGRSHPWRLMHPVHK